jgi:Tfp pilus assembly PilM family ATPase
MAVRDAIAVGVCRGRLNGVWGTLSQSRLEVKRAVTAQADEGIDLDDAEAVGRWVGQELRDAGFPKGKAIVALSRDQVGFKRMTLPTTDPTELPGMTRLALQRELPFDATDAVIDFVPIDQTETSTTVLAVAAPAGVLEHARVMLKTAGFGVEGVSLRVMGASTLACSLGNSPEEAVLSIDVNGQGAEFSVVGNGAVRFSRAADFTNGGASADIVVTETRRTWMSYRIVEDAEDVRQAILIGNPKVIEEAAPPIGDMLKVPAAVLDKHPMVDPGRADLGSAWPLTGLLLQTVQTQPAINLNEPRQPPDVFARRRQVALGAAGFLVVVIAGLYMLGLVKLKQLGETEQMLEAEYRTKFPARMRLKRDQYKVIHLEQWQTMHAAWLDHLQEVAALAPAPGEIMLEQWTGQLQTRGVRFDRKKPKDQRWSAPFAIRIAVEGEAGSRMVADDYRAALVRSPMYRATAVGAETANGSRLDAGFTYTLHTIEGDPDASDDTSDPDTGDAS